MRAAGDESDTDSDDFMSFNGLSYEPENIKKLPKMESRGFQSESQLIEMQDTAELRSTKKTLEQCRNFEEFRTAALNGNLEVIDKYVAEELMIKFITKYTAEGFDVNQTLKHGWTALLYACGGAYHRVVKFLLDRGADPNQAREKYTPLMAACASTKSGDDVLICIRLLLNAGAIVNASEKHEMTPLMFAAKTGKEEVVKVLIEAGATVNAADTRGWTPLSWASNYGHGCVVKVLIEANADPKQVGPSGETAQHVASSSGFNQIAEVLHKLQEAEEDPAIADLSLLDDLPKQEIAKQPSETSQKYQKYDELHTFLVGLQLSELIQIFTDNQISFQTLMTLNEEDLINLGIDKLGIRRKILDAVRDLHKKEWSTTSIPRVRNQKHISCPEAYAIVGNISKHLNFIQSTMTYLHKQSKLNPDDLELGKSDVDVSMLLDQAESAYQSLHTLESEMELYKEFLAKAAKQIENVPVGVIGNQRRVQKRRYFFIPPLCILTVSLLGAFGAFHLRSHLRKLFSVFTSKAPSIR